MTITDFRKQRAFLHRGTDTTTAPSEIWQSTSVPKNVYLESPWLPVPYTGNLLNYPPDGYSFVASSHDGSEEQKLFRKIGASPLGQRDFYALDAAVPLTLLRSRLFQRRTKIPHEARLTYSIQHLVFRPEPWMLEAEGPQFLIGNGSKHLRRFKKIIERNLASRNCRGILCWSEAGRRSFFSSLDCDRFSDKIELIRLAVPPKPLVPPKDYHPHPVKLLFVGSMRGHDQFSVKGGREALAAFIQLQNRYPDLQMVVRSEMPEEIKTKYRDIRHLRIIDKCIPREELEREYLTSDIFVLPSYNTTPHAILEAMSYELAVVSLNSWANAEYVKQGHTGLLAEPSRKVPWELYGSKEFNEVVREPQNEVVDQLVRTIGMLIENADLRHKLAKNGRYEAADGEFSIGSRNKKLKAVFDNAIEKGIPDLQG